MDKYYREHFESKVCCAWMVIGSIIMSAIFVLIAMCFEAKAEIYDSEAIADAIYQAEGGEKAKKPYGILSVKCHDAKDCRNVCLNTIENNFTRWQISGAKKDFLEFLAERYAPVKSHPLNRNWLRNVKYFLAKEDK